MNDPSVSPSILGMPDEILVMIFLHFDARERLVLGKSCQKFYDLVFGDQELLTNLDFTGKWPDIEESDIQKYFNDGNSYEKILRINAESVQGVKRLDSSICKAIYLVELNILDVSVFDCVEDLSNFLKPLVHLKRLSLDWPSPYRSIETECHDPNCKEILKESLTRLTYLSLGVRRYSYEFIRILELCQGLKELRMSIEGDVLSHERPLQEHMKLSNLKSVQIRVTEHLEQITNHLMSIVPDRTEWTNFYLVNLHSKAYLEKDVEVCEELRHLKEMRLPDYMADINIRTIIDKRLLLVPEHLVSEVIKINFKDVPKKFCCLSSAQHYYSRPCLLDIDEAKKLLKDPGFQISYLHLSHVVKRNCDVHLLASAFPNLTTLVLSWIINTPKKTKPLRRRLSRKGSLASNEHRNATNVDSSFKMLVDNTPGLKVLEISPAYGEQNGKYWDTDALHLISGWKYLTVIRLRYIPIIDGEFLIHIGRECKKLEEFELHHLPLDNGYSYESKVLRMLEHCENLRKLSITHLNLEYLSEMFDILSNCSRLEGFFLQAGIKKLDLLKMGLSLEKMVRQCRRLNRFSTDLDPWKISKEVFSAVERIRRELDRPKLISKPISNLGRTSIETAHTMHYFEKLSSPFRTTNDLPYLLSCEFSN